MSWNAVHGGTGNGRAFKIHDCFVVLSLGKCNSEQKIQGQYTAVHILISLNAVSIVKQKSATLNSAASFAPKLIALSPACGRNVL